MDYSRVARYYDLYARTEVDVPFFLEQAQGCRNVLELTSGTGRLSIPLLEGGVRLSCLDSSPEMLAILREKLAARRLSAPVYEMDVSCFKLPEVYDLIFIPFNSFAEITEREAQLSTLTAVREHLTEDGKFICTFHNPAVRLRAVDGKLYLRGEYALLGNAGTLKLWSREEYDSGTQMVRGEQVYEIYAPGGELAERWSVEICFCLYSKETFGKLVGSAGFELDAIYGDYAKSAYRESESPFMIWTLHKSEGS